MKLSNESCSRIAASLDFTKPAGLEAADQKFLAAKIRAALHGSGVNPLDFGCLWIALIDRETEQELSNRLLYAEDGPNLVFDVTEFWNRRHRLVCRRARRESAVLDLAADVGRL